MRKKALLAAIVGLVTLGIAALAIRTPEPVATVPEEIQAILRAQEERPPAEVEVMQALRVVSAVEMVFFTKNGRYAAPEELVSSGMLDPAWPRVDSQAYQISCEIGEERLGFQCFADPAPPYSQHYYVNPSQVVRFENDRRPDENSPVFGLSKENL